VSGVTLRTATCWLNLSASPRSGKSLANFFYSNPPGRDAAISMIFFLVPFYQLFLLVARLVAATEEIFWRKSFQDDFVPRNVREATWHW
jgi:hypothetical protein